MNKLQHPKYKPLLPERVSEKYNRNMLTYSFINENKWEGSMFVYWQQG